MSAHYETLARDIRIMYAHRFMAVVPGYLIADIMYVRLASGSLAYEAFVTNAYARRIVGWAASTRQHTKDLPLLALDQLCFVMSSCAVSSLFLCSVNKTSPLQYHQHQAISITPKTNTTT